MRTTERRRIRECIETLTLQYGKDRSSMLPILQAIQEDMGYIATYAMQEIARQLDTSVAHVYGVVTFYSFLTHVPKGKFVLRLCRTISCDMAGKESVARQLENELGIEFGATTPDDLFTLEYTNCLGMCDQGPALMVNDQIFTRVTPARVYEIIAMCRKAAGGGNTHIMGDMPVSAKVGGPMIFSNMDHDSGLKAALAKKPEEVVEIVTDAYLRGRGGAGFPTGLKWKSAAQSPGEKRYMICNADEGEPGTFKDRAILFERVPVLLEGMAIAAYAVGATDGIIYLRAEYAYLRPMINVELERRRSEGLLGKNIMGHDGFNFDIEIRMGSGAYICGEEMALIESLEGDRGEPRNRPPYPVTRGYKDCPTVVNNVETFVAAAHILGKGAEWFKALGTEQSHGSKLFSVSGDCDHPGLYELPFGITVRELIHEVGGNQPKAVQVGGASGTLVPQSQFDRTIAFEGIPTGGSIMIFGQNRDMLDVAIDFLEFFAEESCGQCTPCRNGTAKLLEGVRLLKEGHCSVKQLNHLQSLGRSMQVTAKCGLGQTSPNIFLYVIEHFRDEILGRVPAATVERSAV
jgi:[NiFe] hydrogenase diaphorase moiety large subunit